MRLNRPLQIHELEQRIVPSFTQLLDLITTSFLYVDADGDTIEVARDVAPIHGSIAVRDNDANPTQGVADFHKIDSIVFNAACDSTTTLTVLVTNPGVGSDGIAKVGYIDFTAPGAIGSIEIQGDVTGLVGNGVLYSPDSPAPLNPPPNPPTGEVPADHDTIAGYTIDSLHIKVADATTGHGGNINVDTGGGLYRAIKLEAPAGFSGIITVDAAITGGDAYAISITGLVTGIINVGDMTAEGIRQFDSAPNANEGFSGATINITGNAAQGLAGNLGGVLSEGSIANTIVTVNGNLDATNLQLPSGAALGDVMSTDWDRNGVGTLTNDTINVPNGNVIGEFTNVPAISGGFWGSPSALQDISDLSLNIHGFFNGYVVSGGSVLSSTFTVNPTADPLIDGADAGRFNADVLAFQDITDLTINARTVGSAGDLTAGPPVVPGLPVIAADAEAAANSLFSLPPIFGLTLAGGKDIGGISNLHVNATEDMTILVGNDFADYNGVGDDVNATLTAGTNMVIAVSAARDLHLNATGTTSLSGGIQDELNAFDAYYVSNGDPTPPEVLATLGLLQGSSGDISVGQDATIIPDFLSIENITMGIGRDLTLTPAAGVTTVFDAEMHVGRDANVTIHFDWIHATLEANRNIVADVLADSGPTAANPINFMDFDADHDNNGTGTLSGSIESHLGLDTGSLIHGATITANVTLERFPGELGADMDMHGQISAGTGGITSNISIDGSLTGGLVSTGNVTGAVTIGGDLTSPINVTGNVASIDIGGSVLNALPSARNEIDISGNLTTLHIGGNVGPGIGPSDTVYIHAANFGTLTIDGNVSSFVDILAGAEPGTGTITTLTIGGTAVPMHLTTIGTFINQIRAVSVPLPYDHLAEIGNKTVQFQLESALGGGMLKLRVSNGSAKFFYSDPDADGKIDQMFGLDVDGGTPSITMTVTGNSSAPTLSFLHAPSYVIPSATSTTLFRSVNAVQFQNINVDEIFISGSAKSIRLTNSNLGDCMIGGAIQVVSPLIDPGNTIGLAELIAVGNIVTGQAIDTTTDVDMYKFTVAAGQRVSFDIDRLAGSSLNSFIRLFNASGTPLASNDNAAASGESFSADSYLEYIFKTAGTYYLGVSGSGNSAYDPISGAGATNSSTGFYTLTLSVPGVGDLGELSVQGNLARGTGKLTGDVSVFHNLTGKIEAMDITGSITVGNNARSIIARHDLAAPIYVNGDLQEIGADNDTNGIDHDIHVGGSLGNLKAGKASFTSTVEVLGSLKGVFDVLGNADLKTRTVGFNPLVNVTVGQYVTGGTLAVHSFVNAKNIK